ncbi:MAG: RNA polymerase sigma factor [Ruminococcus sp.]|nr:RNA polymerase sigma factor [Ruminococcus sp.]
MARLYAQLSYEEAVHKYAKTVYTACVVRLSGNADVDDCVQNTFVQLYRSSPDFNDENHLKAWLLRVAINECRKSRRLSSRFVPLDQLENCPSPSSDRDDDEARDLTRALLSLKPKYREVLYLHYYEDYKVDEIAVILNTKSGTVKSLLSRGRRMLKELYGGDDA